MDGVTLSSKIKLNFFNKSNLEPKLVKGPLEIDERVQYTAK